jgi:SAM-dependent methyltransferase
MEKRPGWSVTGYEMSEPAVQFARSRNKLLNVFPGMVQRSRFKENTHDIITMWDVIEHIPRPQPLLKYLHSILKPGGILFMQTPNFPIQLFKAKLKVLLKGMKEDVHYLEAKDHINDYTRSTMNRLATDTGFQKPQYFIMKPILSVAGGGGSLGKSAKLGYYYITKYLWFMSFKTLFLNNTLFTILKK